MKPFLIIAFSVCFLLTLESCTISEEAYTQRVECPRQDNSITVDPWDDSDNAGSENIGN